MFKDIKKLNKKKQKLSVHFTFEIRFENQLF